MTSLVVETRVSGVGVGVSATVPGVVLVFVNVVVPAEENSVVGVIVV